MEMRALLWTAALIGSSAESVELTHKNFEKKVFGSAKRGAFVKFQAPWCGHCKKLKPDWDDLGDEFEKSKKVLIGDVDCTAKGNDDLCKKYDVTGYPTLRYFPAGSRKDSKGDVYEGERTMVEMKKFAKTLGPQCSALNLKLCNAEQKEALAPLMAMPVDELQAQIARTQSQIDEAQTEHDATVKQLQETYEASSKKLDELKKELNPRLKLLRSALPAEDAPPAEEKKEL